MLKQLIRWGTGPARIASAVMIFYGAYLVIVNGITLSALPSGDEGDLLAAPIFVGMFDAALLIGLGALIIGLTWMTRRRKRAVAIGGQVISFFAAGLLITYVLAWSVTGPMLIAAPTAGACLLLAAATSLAG